MVNKHSLASSLAFECFNIALVYVLLTNRRSKLRISLSIRLASEIIILLASYQSFACNACQCCRSMKLFILLISCSQASRYGFIMVCLIYLLLLAGDIKMNPGPLPGECAPSPKRDPGVPSLSTIECSGSEVMEVLAGLKVKKACGPDGITATILKKCAPSIADALAEVFNTSLAEGRLPSECCGGELSPYLAALPCFQDA